VKTASESAGETAGAPEAYGVASYFHAGGIDRPLVITKGSTSIIPHQNWRGQFARGTYADGRPSDCETSQTTGCTPIQWPGYRTTAWHAAAKDPDIRNWFGGLTDGMRDASGQMYKRNRYYDPATGQFTQPDPIGIAGGLNVYGFAAGDPVSYSDPYGLCPPKLLCDLIGASAGEDATQYWAERANSSTGLSKAVATGAGLLAALWTPDTYTATATTLVSGAGAGRVIRARQQAPRTNTSPEIHPREIAGRSPAEIDQIARARGLQPKGPNPAQGQGSYVDPVTGNQRILSHPNACQPHCHVNNPAGQRLDINGRVVPNESPAATFRSGNSR
jgi:RHS repeat-associated protein